jgi:hypothetical protein
MALYAVTVWMKPAQLGWELALNTMLLLVYVAVILYNEQPLVKQVLGKIRKK